MNALWLEFCAQSEAAALQLYEAVISILEATDWNQPAQAQASYQLLKVFHSKNYRASTTHLESALRQFSPRVLALVEKLAPCSRQIIIAGATKLQTVTVINVLEMLLAIYYYHIGGLDHDDLQAAAADWLLPLVRENPDFGDSLTLRLLEAHPQRARIISELLDFYLGLDPDASNYGMYLHIRSDLLENDGSSFIYADLDKITDHLTVFAQRWTEPQYETFVSDCFFYHPDADEERRRLLKKSAKARRLAHMLVAGDRHGPHIDALRALCHNAAAPAMTMILPTEGKQQFKDLNFKLLVIEELMYTRKTLLPCFDLHEFAKQYCEREILIEKEGYAVLPEALAYFEGLLIPDALLAQVETLGFDGGNEVYRQIFRYWDGECDSFEVGGIEDVALLPNLKEISGMSEAFVARFAGELAKKGIEVEALA
ncbi:MAG: hypothetical protein RL748_2698 [Pseudomonadota bacterium]